MKWKVKWNKNWQRLCQQAYILGLQPQKNQKTSPQKSTKWQVQAKKSCSRLVMSLLLLIRSIAQAIRTYSEAALPNQKKNQTLNRCSKTLNQCSRWAKDSQQKVRSHRNKHPSKKAKRVWKNNQASRNQKRKVLVVTAQKQVSSVQSISLSLGLWAISETPACLNRNQKSARVQLNWQQAKEQSEWRNLVHSNLVQKLFQLDSITHLTMKKEK